MIYLHTLGCPKNIVDSEKLKKRLIGEGLKVYDEYIENTDIILINTCGFIESAKRESIEEILRLSKIKNGRRLLVFGCLSERYKDELRKELPEIDELFGVKEEERIVQYCKQVSTPHTPASDETKDIKPYSYLKIADGCNRRCSFCIIPSIKGQYRSLPPDEILREAQALIKSGKKELILIAEDITSYGKDLRGYDLSRLLKDMVSISGDFWLRLLYLYPSGIDDGLIRVIEYEDKICKYLDIPLQHSEERLLRLMAREGSKIGYKNLISRIRRAIPEITLRTTFIVGFPTETENDFQGLLDFVIEMGFENLGVFKYSREEGTKAGDMKGQVPENIKNRRYDELMRLQSEVSLEKNKNLLGNIMRALADEPDTVRLSSQAPEIDGVIFLKERVKRGDFINVRLISAMDYDLIAEVVK